MPRTSHELDRQPGALPEIRTTVENITFSMGIAGAPKGEHLVIRCGAKGDVWIAIATEPRGA